MKVGVLRFAAALFIISADTTSAKIEINGVKGKLEFTDQVCSDSSSTSAQCQVAAGGLCANNMCAATTSTCNPAGDGCLDMFGSPESCEEPANRCGGEFCGTPPVYDDCQCKGNICYAMKFVPDGGSSEVNINSGDNTVQINSGDNTSAAENAFEPSARFLSVVGFLALLLFDG